MKCANTTISVYESCSDWCVKLSRVEIRGSVWVSHKRETQLSALNRKMVNFLISTWALQQDEWTLLVNTFVSLRDNSVWRGLATNILIAFAFISFYNMGHGSYFNVTLLYYLITRICLCDYKYHYKWAHCLGGKYCNNFLTVTCIQKTTEEKKIKICICFCYVAYFLLYV